MRCFVIRGFGEKKDAKGQPIDFDKVHRELIAPALQACDLAGDTTVEVVGAGQIQQDMFQLILQADVVICDITVHNPNVFYELGVRHALRRKHTVLIKGTPSADATPFDISGVRYMTYEIDDPGKARQALVDAINASLARDRETDSPVFLMMPQLPAADVTRITTVPVTFAEEVQLAAKRRDKGWLRLLAEDVRGETFEREGMRLIGRAQWKQANDFKEAVKTWEFVRAGSDGDLEANLALANVYDRVYKQSKDPADLERSNQAIQRVLADANASSLQRSEASALHGRNLKTLWRLNFANLESLEERRERAIDPQAKDSYEAYRNAYNADLNNFFPGLGALQMGKILQSLARNGASFQRLFDDDPGDADRYVQALERELASLQHVVRASIERGREAAQSEDDRIWAKVSAADLRFLTLVDGATEANIANLVGRYRDVVPPRSFYSDAAYGQMALFEQLGVGAQAARAVMAELGEPNVPDRRHVVVFSGHTVDRTGADRPPVPRFPSTTQARAGALIQATLVDLQREDGAVTVLCSAAPGADILALEACQQLGIKTWLCLPLERTAVGREGFSRYEDADAWRNRFLDLAEAHAKPPPGRTLVLSDSERLPDWLRGREATGMTPWSRGNRWMLHQALAWGADKVTLLAFWDHSETDTSAEGTAAMIRLARSAGIRIKPIDSRALAAESVGAAPLAAESQT
jgi:hypothetical protein